MKSIYCASNMQNGLFPGNTRSLFETFTPLQDLGYIAKDDIKEAIKTIIFDNTREVNTNSEWLALKTNLTPDQYQVSDGTK